MTKKKPKPTPRMTDEQLKEFVMGYCNGQIFTSSMLGSQLEHLGRLVFMPLGFGALEDIDPATIGLIWEWKNAPGQVPRSINGFPMFTSCRLMHDLDLARAQKAIDVEMERRKEVKV